MNEIENIKENSFSATVVKVIDDHKVVINKGSSNGIKIGQRFLIYKLEDDPILDPDTGENLGHLEIVRGTGKVTHLQKKLSTVESDMMSKSERRTIKRRSFAPWAIGPEEEIITPSDYNEPYEDPQLGDKAKPI